tara:strand:+ start:295 stop:633 length:339 start_codon:yes stop_codon:yes gene_type:complete
MADMDNKQMKGQNVRMGETIDASKEQIEDVLGLNPRRAVTQRYVQAIFNQWIGHREQALADLQIYMENAVGVGEHSNIGEEIKKKIAEVDKYDSLVETVQKYFSEKQVDDSP